MIKQYFAEDLRTGRLLVFGVTVPDDAEVQADLDALPEIEEPFVHEIEPANRQKGLIFFKGKFWGSK